VPLLEVLHGRASQLVQRQDVVALRHLRARVSVVTFRAQKLATLPAPELRNARSVGAFLTGNIVRMTLYLQCI